MAKEWSTEEIERIHDRRSDERAESHPFHDKQIQVLRAIVKDALDINESHLQLKLQDMENKLVGVPEVVSYVKDQKANKHWAKGFLRDAAMVAAMVTAWIALNAMK